MEALVKKQLLFALVLFVAFCLLCNISSAGNNKNGKAGKSNTAHLYLFEKDPADWSVIENGSWGKMRYDLSGDLFDFVFNAHELTAYQNYTLIYYPDPWPGKGLIRLGCSMANDEGDVHISDKIKSGDLPKAYDDNYPNGSKIWLVLSDDVDPIDNMMIGWNPNEYLFENGLLIFDDTNEEPAEINVEATITIKTITTNEIDIKEFSGNPQMINEKSVTESQQDKDQKTQALSILLDKMIVKKEIMPKGLVKIWMDLGLMR